MSASVLCGACKVRLADDFDANGRKPCPSCGSVVRTYEEHVEETLTVYDSVRWKHKRPGRKKPLAEGMSGYERTVATGRWAEKVSVIDRENNRRIERVVEVGTGKVLKEYAPDYKLTDHRGHGSDKTRKQND